MINVDLSVKNIIYVKKIYFEPGTCKCNNGKYQENIMDGSVIKFDQIIESCDEETKTFPTNFNGKKATYQTKNFYIFLEFLLITIASLIAVSIYCYLIKFWPKQKHLLPFYITNNELKEFSIKEFLIQIKNE